MSVIPQLGAKSPSRRAKTAESDFPLFAGFRNPKANFTLSPNQFFDVVMFGPYKPGVKVVVAAVIRGTLGWEDPDTGERRLETGLSLGDLEACGLCRQTARESIDGAISAGFIIQTSEATTHSPARYALRWADAAAQKQAIIRQRKAHGGAKRRGGKVEAPRSPKRIARGLKNSPPVPTDGDGGLKNRPLNSRRPESSPPNNRDSETNPSPEKKEDSEKGDVQLSLMGEEDPDPTAPSAEEIAAVRAAIVVPPEPPKKLTYKDIQAAWDAMPPDDRDVYRPEALAQLREAGHPSPNEKQIEPTMFKLFWVKQKGLGAS